MASWLAVYVGGPAAAAIWCVAVTIWNRTQERQCARMIALGRRQS